MMNRSPPGTAGSPQPEPHGDPLLPEWTSSAISETGQRPANEDRYLEAPEIGLWAVADGMGGHADGEIASATALEGLEDTVREGRPLAEAVSTANRATCREAQRRRSDMGTTLVALRLHPDRYEVAWLGDSRAYLWDGESLRLLTTDHTMVQHWVEEGRLAPEEARGHPYGHVLTRAVGLDPEAEPDCREGDPRAASAFLLCTDGITDSLSDERIAASLTEGSGAAALERMAGTIRELADPFQDNLTAVLVQPR